jgi:Glycosyltransferase family 87
VRVTPARLFALLVLLGVLFSAAELVRSPFLRADGEFDDLRALWCAGRAVDQHADPYRVEPERTCQQVIAIETLRDSPNLVMSFVLPGYDAAGAALLALLPLRLAIAVFVALALAALLTAVFLLVRVLGVPAPLAVAALAFSAGYPSLTLGQVGAFELLAIVASAAALHAGRDRWAGVLAAAALLEPHLGAFVGLAVLAFAPRARVAYVLGAAALLVLAVAATGPAAQLHYLVHELPQQGLAEARQDQQYSATFVATALGVPIPAALALGALSTMVMLGVALVLARRFGARERAAVVLLPAACAVCGGVYLHYAQVAVAVPAALLLVGMARTPRERILAGVAVVLLAIPWYDVALVKQLLAPALTTLAVLVWSLTGGSVRAVAAAVVACWLVLVPTENRPPAAPPPPVVSRLPGDASATSAWVEVARSIGRPDLWHVAVKVPTWLSLIALVIAAGAIGWERPRAR